MRPGHTISRRKVALAAASVTGLLLAVAALTPAAIAVESLPARIVLDLPAWLAVPFAVLIGLEFLFIVLVLVTGPKSQRKKLELPSRKSIAPGFLLLVFVLLWIGLRDRLGIDISAVWPGGALFGGVPEALELPGANAPPPIHSPLITGLMEALLLLLAALGFGVMAWLFLGFWPQRGDGLPSSPSVPVGMQAAVEDSLDDLRRLPDPRIAIIRCYGRFETVLAGADVRRPPWETAAEFVARALRHPWLPPEAVRELTALFEIARFSRHDLGPGHRERAWQALMSVKAALEDEDRRASAA